jgi:hypothetical protein
MITMCTEGAPSLVGLTPLERLAQHSAGAVDAAITLAPRTYNLDAARIAACPHRGADEPHPGNHDTATNGPNNRAKHAARVFVVIFGP